MGKHPSTTRASCGRRLPWSFWRLLALVKYLTSLCGSLDAAVEWLEGPSIPTRRPRRNKSPTGTLPFGLRTLHIMIPPCLSSTSIPSPIRTQGAPLPCNSSQTLHISGVRELLG
ncbi:Lipase [Fusarium oxysporum f. sp. albedinis]|nr:Lipase [Fusarium oxysporum f. sp. albedinis]